MFAPNSAFPQLEILSFLVCRFVCVVSVNVTFSSVLFFSPFRFSFLLTSQMTPFVFSFDGLYEHLHPRNPPKSRTAVTSAIVLDVHPPFVVSLSRLVSLYFCMEIWSCRQ